MSKTVAEIVAARAAAQETIVSKHIPGPDPIPGLVRLDFYGKSAGQYVVPKNMDIKAEWEKHKKDHHFAQDKELVWPRDFQAHIIANLGCVKSDVQTEEVISLT